MDQSGALQLLESDGVPGAKLSMDRLELYHIDDLKRWLKCRGLKLDGVKGQLIARIRKRAATPWGHVLDLGCDDGKWLEKKRRKVLLELGVKIPEAPIVPITGWESFPGYDIPKCFNMGHVVYYIVESANVSVLPTVLPVNADESEEEDDEENDYVSGTKEALARGQQYIKSKFVVNVRDRLLGKFYFLKAEVRASMKLELRNVTVTLSVQSGSVVDASCTCKQRTTKRCSHVSALLIFICKHVEEKGYGALACTSKAKEWGKGKVTRNPGKGVDKEYCKRDLKSRVEWDPRPSCFQNNEPFTEIELFQFNKMVQRSLTFVGDDDDRNCPFLKHLPITYEDYELSDDDYILLNQNLCNFYTDFQEQFSSEEGPVKFAGTVAQSKSDLWKSARSIMLTASVAKKVLGLKSNKAKGNFLRNHLWRMNQVETRAMRYGTDNEKIARRKYRSLMKKLYGEDNVRVVKTGLWGKQTAPFLGCSPDGIVTVNGVRRLLEIKCLWLVRRIHPKKFENHLKNEQLSRFPLEKISSKQFELKRNHMHHYQVQMAMDVMDVEECDYFLWSKYGHVRVTVQRDREFWRPKIKKLIDLHVTLLMPEYFLMRTPRYLDPIPCERQEDEE